MKEVSLRGITKTFGQLTVLDRVDLDIQSGNFSCSSVLRAAGNPRFCGWWPGLNRFPAAIS